MSKARYLQITFNFHGPPKDKELEGAFNKALDWIRITPQAWIVWTTSEPNVWYTRLKHKIGEKDHVYIFGIDNKVRYGWAPMQVWEWLDKKR